MKNASKVFFLAFFALFDPSNARSHATTTPTCAFEPNAIVSDACVSYETIDRLNSKLSDSVKTVTQTTDFFSYYRLNLYNRVCPFWNDESGMCGNRACAVDTLDNEEDVPKIWRTEELSRLQGPKAKHPSRKEQKERKKPLEGNLTDNVSESCVVEYDDECDERDYCILEDESASAKGDYVSLVDNPEKFTGYTGEGAHMVWDAIYKENCFSKQAATATPSKAQGGILPAEAANALRSVLQANSDPSDFGSDDTCLEERVFYRIISGMHASISAHLCYDYLDQKTGTWGPNLSCYEERLANFPDRISNLYFNYALVLRAVAKLQPHIQSYTFCTGDPDQDLDTKKKVLAVAETAASVPPIFDETLMFQDAAALELKQDFRNRFRNVSRLMDCVGCDKCRLWGKLQTAGYGTALKVLFEFDEDEDFSLKRTELVALVNTLDRIGTSIKALAHFRKTLDSTVQQPPPSSPSKAEVSPDTEFDEFERSHEEFVGFDEPSAAEEALEELYLVFRTMRFVLKSWVEMPWKAFYITVYELGRYWNMFMGLKVMPRDYSWMRQPTRDEL